VGGIGFAASQAIVTIARISKLAAARGRTHILLRAAGRKMARHGAYGQEVSSQLADGSCRSRASLVIFWLPQENFKRACHVPLDTQP
jgi:hypothetical protein